MRTGWYGFAILIVLVGSCAGIAGHYLHSRKANNAKSESDKVVTARDATIAAQQNTLSTNATTIEGFRAELQFVTRDNTAIQRRYEDARQERDTAKAQLAPFLAAGNLYFSNAPTAERLGVLLSVLTNSSADVRELTRLQSRQAKLQVMFVGEGAGWDHFAGPIESGCVLYFPLFAGATNAAIHFTISNKGELPAEIIHFEFLCPTQQVCSAAQWEDQSGFSMTIGESQFLVKVDAVYPNGMFSLPALRFSIPP